MLQSIREHTQGWIAGIIITIIILTFALWGIHSYFVEGTNNTNVAEVNGVTISKEQLAVAYERLRRQTQVQYGTNNPASGKEESALKDRALQALIDIEILKQASTAQGYRISDRQIDSYLEGMPEFQINGRFSVDRFQEVLASTLLSTSEVLDLIKTSLLIDQPRLGILFTSFALPDETTYTIGLVNQMRDIEYINIPLQMVLSQPIVIPAADIEAYYQTHKNDFMTPEQVNVEYVELSLKDLSNKISVSDAVLKNFYNENINAYTQPMQWKYEQIIIPAPASATADTFAAIQQKANAVLQELKNGGDPNKVVTPDTGRVVTQDWVTLNQVPEELQKAVANLTKPGQLTDVFKTNKGFVILKAVDIQEPKMQAFDAVKDKVKDTYVRQHAEEKLAELRDQLADITYEHPDSLQIAVKTMNLPIMTSELFSKEKGGKDISQYKKVRDIAFSNDVMNLQNNSDIIQLNPETVIVLRVKSHIPSTLLPLKDISKQIEDKLKMEEAVNRLAKFANDLKTQLQAGADPQQLANAHHFTWNKTGLMGRYSTKIDSAILDLAFRLPNPATVHSKVTYGVTRLPTGYAIVALKTVKDGTVADKKQYAVFAEQIQNSNGLLEYELYKQSQGAHAKVKMLQQ